MRRSDHSPTHGWLITNKLLRLLAGAFIISSVIIFIFVWTIRYSIDRDCSNPYERDVQISHYWISIKAGSTQEGCPNG